MPPERGPRSLLCAQGPGCAPAPPSPSAVLIAEAEKIRAYSPFLIGEENLSPALRRRFHLMLIVRYLYHVLGYHTYKDKKM